MPDIDLEQESVWEQLPEEADDAYRAFAVYRGLGAAATVEEACRKASGGDPAPDMLAQWQAWSVEWAWQGRAEKHRQWSQSAAEEARKLADRWSSAKEFYASDEERPAGFLSRLFGRRGRHHRSSHRSGAPSGKRIQVRPEGKPSAIKKWAQEREARRHFKAQEAAALRSAKSTKKRTLAERWTLWVRKRRDEAKRNRDKGIRGWFRRRFTRLRVYARRRFGRFVFAFAAVMFILGLATGVLGMRWRRQRFQTGVVLTINGDSIRRDTIQSKIEQYGGKPVMQDIIEQTLRRQFARAKGAYPKESEVDARVAEDQKQPDFAKSIAAAGLSLQDYRNIVRDELAQVNLMAKGVTITDKEVRRYYEIHSDKKNPRARFYTPETVQVAVIGTRSREAAEAALEDLRQGVVWEEVARKHSQDTSAYQGGVLPPFGRGRTLCAQIPGMEQAIFGMTPGQRIGPVKFGEGWWIIQCRDKQPERTMPFESVKHRARAWALLEKGVPINGRRVASEYAAFQKKAKVQVFDPFFRSLMPR